MIDEAWFFTLCHSPSFSRSWLVLSIESVQGYCVWLFEKKDWRKAGVRGAHRDWLDVRQHGDSTVCKPCHPQPAAVYPHCDSFIKSRCPFQHRDSPCVPGHFLAMDLMHHWQPCFWTASAILIVLSTVIAKDAVSSVHVQYWLRVQTLLNRFLFLGGWKCVPRTWQARRSLLAHGCLVSLFFFLSSRLASSLALEG